MDLIVRANRDKFEEGFPPRQIMEKLEKLFGLTMDEAQGYLEKYAATHPGD